MEAFSGRRSSHGPGPNLRLSLSLSRSVCVCVSLSLQREVDVGGLLLTAVAHVATICRHSQPDLLSAVRRPDVESAGSTDPCAPSLDLVSLS